MRMSYPLQERAADALVEARAYAASDAGRAFVRLLEAVEEQYRADLEEVTPGRLVELQTALKQCASLRRAITSEQPLDPKIL